MPLFPARAGSALFGNRVQVLSVQPAFSGGVPVQPRSGATSLCFRAAFASGVPMRLPVRLVQACGFTLQLRSRPVVASRRVGDRRLAGVLGAARVTALVCETHMPACGVRRLSR
jgi:hypothetical protein